MLVANCSSKTTAPLLRHTRTHTQTALDVSQLHSVVVVASAVFSAKTSLLGYLHRNMASPALPNAAAVLSSGVDVDDIVPKVVDRLNVADNAGFKKCLDKFRHDKNNKYVPPTNDTRALDLCVRAAVPASLICSFVPSAALSLCSRAWVGGCGKQARVL